MIEIVPNWHPMFVHFTIALYVTAGLLYLAGILVPRGWRGATLAAARINLWAGALISLATVAAGIHAFLTVPRGPALLPRIAGHRNWAVMTALLWWLLALREAWNARRRRMPRRAFVALALLAFVPLTVTGWKGAELVYRYGVGVLPVSADRPGVERQGAVTVGSTRRVAVGTTAGSGGFRAGS